MVERQKIQTVLVVEDNEALGSVMMNKLESAGYRAVRAEDGEQGLAMIESEHPDLVLLDILLPKVNGYEVLETLNASGKIQELPVIILSNSGQPVEINRLLRLGARDYFVKADFSPDEVLEKVHAVLAKETAAQESSERRGMSILMIEDDELLRTLFVQGTKESGSNDEIIYAKSGEDGLKILETRKPTVILLDLLMTGGIDGFQTLSQIRQDRRYDDIPVVILSNLGKQEDIERTKQLGADEFLIKSNYSIPEILNRVRLSVSRGRTKQE